MSRTVWITLYIAFANSLSFTILIPILYLYGREFGLTDFQTSLLFAIYAGAQFFATPVLGRLSDRFGRKPLLIISLAGTVIANLLAGTAGNAGILFFARFLDGITGGNVSVAQAIISDTCPPEQRAKAFGMFGAVTFGLGFVVGSALSLWAQQVSLAAGFLASSAIALVALIMTVIALPETLKTKIAKPQNPFDIGLSSLITGLVMPKLGILFVINFLIGTTFTIFTFGFQPYYIHVLGQNNQSLTLLFMALGLIAVAVQINGIPWLVKRFSLVKIMLTGILARSLAFFWMPIFPNIIYFVCVGLVFGVFNAVVQPMITTLISLNAKPEVQGTALGINASYLNVSNAFGPVIAGSIVNQAYPVTYGYPLYLAGVLTFAVFLFAIANRQKYTPSKT